MTTFLSRVEPVAGPVLGLPEHHALAATVFLGYPEREVTRLRRRPSRSSPPSTDSTVPRSAGDVSPSGRFDGTEVGGQARLGTQPAHERKCTTMTIELPALPFAPDALESRGLSKETIEYHYGKHHQTYVTNLNGLIEGTELRRRVARGDHRAPRTSGDGVFNNAAQVWNHTFYWNCLSPDAAAASRAATSASRSTRRSARTRRSPRSSRQRPRRSSGPAGRGSSTTAA